MLGVNQGIIMVLAVVVIGGLVGRRARLPGRRRAPAQRVRPGRRRVARDPRPRHHPRPRHAVNRQGATRGTPGERGTTKEGSCHVVSARRAARSPRSSRRDRDVAGRRAALGAGSAPACGKVVVNEQAWAGSTANTYIAKYVLEERLGCEVEITKITEIPVFQAMADGKVDLVLEDWQHVDQYKQYITKEEGRIRRQARRGRAHRLVRPRVPAPAVPAVQDVAGLKGKESVFKSPSRARRECSSAATRRTCRRTRS